MTNKRNLPGLLFLVLVSGFIFAGCMSGPSGQTTAHENPSIVSVGTGFFITSDGYVVTSAHVIEGARVIGVWVNGNRYRADAVAVDDDTDVAILKINYRPSRFFRLANFSSANIGDRVYALGFPLTNILGSESRLTEGIINAFSGYDSDQRLFQMSASVQPGNSGGPVFNSRFEVLGVVESKINPEIATNINFAVKNTYITSILPHDVWLSGGNVRNIREAISATVQISTDDIFDGPPVTIVNNTGFNVRSVYISQIASDVWGQDRLAPNQTLNNGESISLNLPFPLNVVNRYDIMLEAVNGNTYPQMDVLVEANSRIVFTGQSSQQVTVQPGTLSGTYIFSSNDSITLSGNNYTLRTTDRTFSGTFSVSGNTFTLAGHNSTTDWIRLPWTIVDSNTIMDSDGDSWRREAPAELSGTYYYDEGLYISFSRNTFIRTMFGDTDSGTYSVSGNTVVFSQSMWGSDTWTIVDENTLSDPEGDLWRRR